MIRPLAGPACLLAHCMASKLAHSHTRMRALTPPMRLSMRVSKWEAWSNTSSALWQMARIVLTVLMGWAPRRVSAPSRMASTPSSTALATSVASALQAGPQVRPDDKRVPHGGQRCGGLRGFSSSMMASTPSSTALATSVASALQAGPQVMAGDKGMPHGD